MTVPGIVVDREKQRQSLVWIREQSLDPNCVESLANRDSDIQLHVIGFQEIRNPPIIEKLVGRLQQ